ncbi:MAG: amidohydrolase family protein, partial [Acidimicrobiales bacterium]
RQGDLRPTIKSFHIEEAVHDFLLSMALAGHFKRFSNLRIASIENGAEFLPDLFRKLRSQDKKMPGYFKEDPVEQFRRHVWINPFWEDDPYEIVELMGADRVIFGSDWPHIEGMPRPLDYVPEVKELSAEDQRRVLRDNTWELTRPAA